MDNRWTKPIGVVLALGCLVAVISRLTALSVNSLNTKRSAELVDQRMRRAYHIYATGSFSEATNEMYSYLTFLTNTSADVRRLRDIDALRYIANEKLAYMAAASGDLTNACEHLRQVYETHQHEAMSGRVSAIPKADFPEFVIRGVEAIDLKTGANWKSEFVLTTNTTAKVKMLFESGLTNPP